MDYRSFNVCTWSFWCLRVHTGVGHTNIESAQHFWFVKSLTNFSCAPDADGVRTPGLCISNPTLYQPSHHVTEDQTPVNRKVFHFFCLKLCLDLELRSPREMGRLGQSTLSVQYWKRARRETEQEPFSWVPWGLSRSCPPPPQESRWCAPPASAWRPPPPLPSATPSSPEDNNDNIDDNGWLID